jgi:hypothetical protein
VSAVANPVPDTAIDAPAAPEDGVRVTTCGITYNVAVAVSMVG